MKILIGISGPKSRENLNATAFFSQALNLEHINMRQAAIDMVAAAIGQHPVDLVHNCMDANVPTMSNKTVTELEFNTQLMLRKMDPRFFIKRTMAAMNLSRNSMNSKIFSGQVVSGISSEIEAMWLRANGGIIIHILDYNNLENFHALHEKNGDIVITNSAEQPITEGALISIAEKIGNTLKKRAA